MSELQISVGRVYRAKKKSRCGIYYNDRQVLWISSDRSLVQYDAPSIGVASHFKKIPMRVFEEWAGSDVTDRMPSGAEWETMP